MLADHPEKTASRRHCWRLCWSPNTPQRWDQRVCCAMCQMPWRGGRGPALIMHSQRRISLLRPRRQRPPRSRRAADERDELAAVVHSMTSSARVRKDSGIVNPRAFAVVRLTTRSNLVGCWTGKSPGFAPRRILSTYSAARRFRSSSSCHRTSVRPFRRTPVAGTSSAGARRAQRC